ncbi:MAG: TIGR02186 family protein [Amphiplicatus sp.]
MKGLLAAFLLVLAAPAKGAEIAIALTEEVVEVNASFSGAELVLFGALAGAEAMSPETRAQYDIVAVVRGPAINFRLIPMLREQIVWTTGPAILVAGAPGILLTASTRPLDEATTPALRRALHLDANALDVAPLIKTTNARAAAIVDARGPAVLGAAFLDAARSAGLIKETANAVSFKKGSLFSIDIELPPTTPVGEYVVDIYLLRDGALVSEDSARLSVNKVGIERGVYELAHARPIAYGIGCVAISLAAGWLAAAAFRKSG